MGSKVGVVVGFATGLTVGYLLGIFSAPQAGQDTLEEIGDKAMQLRGKVEETAERVKDELLGSRASATNLGDR